MKINRLITDVNCWEGRYGNEIEWIVMHYTAGNGDTAKGNCLYFKDVYRAASAHFFVDDTSVWQSVELSDSAWHCGDNPPSHNGATNLNSIGIEMCSRIDSNGVYYLTYNTVQNAAELVWYLLDMFPNAKLCRHYDVTGKRCPMPWVDDPAQWLEFERKIREDKPMTPAEKKEMDALKSQVAALEKALEKITKDYKSADEAIKKAYKADDAALGKKIAKNSEADAKLTEAVEALKVAQKNTAILAAQVDSRTEVKYNTVDECPKWLKPTVEKLVDKKYLKGDKNGLALTNDLARGLTINDRAGVYDE